MTLDHLTHLRLESARFLDVLRAVAPGTGVPTCPEWDAADLLWHLAEVQWFWGTIVRERRDSPDGLDRVSRPDTYDGLVAHFAESHRALVDALTATPDDTALWTWSSDNTAGFVRRRMAQEALVHRLDAELTAGRVSDVDPDLAADGVSEAFEHMFGGTPSWATITPTGPIGALHATDIGHTWRLQFALANGTSPNSGVTFTDEPSVLLLEDGDPTFTVRATARDLDAWVWSRPTLAPLSVTGDSHDYERLVAILAEGID